MARTYKDNSSMLSSAAPRVPKSIKKNGNGKANWGEPGSDDIIDNEFNFTHQRRRSNSNSFSDSVRTFKTKFDVNEPEAVSEKDIHGPSDDEQEQLSKTDTSESASNASYEL